MYVPVAAQSFFQFSEESNTAQDNTVQETVVQLDLADEGNSDDEFELTTTGFWSLNIREEAVNRDRNEKVHCPLFTRAVLESDRATGSASFPMYGLLGTITSGPGFLDERLYLNTNTPLSGLICGVQGSGKSHTLNCMLENYLLPGLGKLPEPMTVLVLHFDSAGGGEASQPCESAYLGKPNPNYIGRPAVTKITVLVSPSNYKTMKSVYSHIPNCTVRPLFFSQGDLNIKRMMSLMSVDETEAKPLYMQVRFIFFL